MVAGGLAWLVCGGLLLAVVAWRSGGAGAARAAVALGFVAGSIMGSAWILTATAMDLLSQRPVGRRRLYWASGLTLCALLSPLVVAAAALSSVA